MDLSGEYKIPVPALRVWQGMNDPALLKRCIWVCESFERVGDDFFEAVIALKIGPFHARFRIDVAIEDSLPPHSYRLIAVGKGGLAGWARGIADVALREEGSDTILAFSAHGEFRGAVARLAARAVEGAAKRYADEFFAAFAREVREAG